MYSHGAFVYDPDYTINKYGSAKKAAQAISALNMSHAWLRAHNKNGLWKTSANKSLADAMRDVGLSVGIWGWCDGNNPDRDLENLDAAVKSYAPDCYIADIENGVSGAQWNVVRAKKFGKEARSLLGETPLVVSSFGYIDWHEPEIMSALDDYADYFAPQVYWFWFPNANMIAQTPISGLKEKSPADYTRACIYHWQQVVTKPLIVTGQAYWGEASGWTQARAEEKLEEFLNEFDGYKDIVGFNWWNFAAERAMSAEMADRIRAADLDQKLRDKSAPQAPTKHADAGASGEAMSESGPGTPATSGAGTIYWVAAEKLFLRSAPDSDDNSNIFQTLDHGVRAIHTGGAIQNGYLPCSVKVDGTDQEGFLFARYLRHNESQLVERAIQEAISEWIRFDKGDGREDRQPYSSYINEMWTARGLPGLSGTDISSPWSAAFISFILENAGYTKTTFDIRHSTYIHESIQNRILGRDRDFIGYRLDEAQPQVGDLLCQWRETETTYDEAETQSRFPSHTDLIIAARPHAVITLGGNVANATSNTRGISVETKTFERLSSGYVKDARRLFAIMKNQHRPKSEQMIAV
ncbi:DUF2272 domain-containing protein [Aurantimonas sp. A3-2-R12]|uniref:DUF2272 domain-containing protein n=1 Tax=Aurantimonas sp. A3-2-R12 TaxID=3114362 RepID=UPI002E1829CD|nr:DUF2272 domain-containing protein [Aurantimonas sp. A3-2-R12]